VCPVEVLCVGACVYNDWHRYPPIQIGRLQRYAVETVFASGTGATLLEKAAPAGKKVACIGAGPASLAAAGYLALEGVTVTIFEKRELPGGLNTTGVAPYKMHAEGSLLEVEYIRALGVEIRTGVEIGRDVAPADLARDYDAVFLGVGLGADTKLGIPGEEGAGVFGATAWIEKLKLDPAYALPEVKSAIVVGGGNTAIDAARELAKLGVPHVALVYRRTAAEMPGYAHEMELARKEGVNLFEKAVPRAFVREGGSLTGLELADGRVAACELAVVAIGQASLREIAAQFTGVNVDARGRIQVDEMTGRTANSKIFAGGDALGGELVVTAAQEGKRAARAICAALGVKARANAPMMAGRE